VVSAFHAMKSIIFPEPRKTGTNLVRAQSKSLSGYRRLAAENSLPKRALNLGGMFCPLVGQELYGAGLILEQF
jgi:hypothetical protein